MEVAKATNKENEAKKKHKKEHKHKHKKHSSDKDKAKKHKKHKKHKRKISGEDGGGTPKSDRYTPETSPSRIPVTVTVNSVENEHILETNGKLLFCNDNYK